MFIKYNSIENHYQEKWINQFLDKFGNELANSTFIVQEKIHGANLQLIFTPDEEMRIASRSQLTDGGFYNVGDVIKKMDLTPFQHWANHIRQPIHVYGELFGPGVQKGVDYGNEKRILFFDMRIAGELLTPCEFESFFENREMIGMTVPVLHYALTLEQALNTNTEINSLLSKAENNECEGVVIKPYNKLFYNNAGSLFYIKKKNKAFTEKTKRVPKPRPEWSDEVNELRDTFLSYLNEERLESVFSKEGRIADRKDIGKYIGFMMKDAIETFNKEENFDEIIEKNGLTKEETKYILSTDNKIREWIINEAV